MAIRKPFYIQVRLINSCFVLTLTSFWFISVVKENNLDQALSTLKEAVETSKLDLTHLDYRTISKLESETKKNGLQFPYVVDPKVKQFCKSSVNSNFGCFFRNGNFSIAKKKKIKKCKYC